jgi:hypothetical protein
MNRSVLEEKQVLSDLSFGGMNRSLRAAPVFRRDKVAASSGESFDT